MNSVQQPHETIIDFITGRSKPNTGAEANRQALEQRLVETKGYDPKDIEVDAVISLDVDGETLQSTIDLVVNVSGKRYMVIKCAAGSLASREREVIAAGRLLEDYQIPISVASDGATAIVWDTVSGNRLGEGFDAIPSKEQAYKTFDPATVVSMDDKRRRQHILVYRTYATRSCAI